MDTLCKEPPGHSTLLQKWNKTVEDFNKNMV
jgi:hypothetical protein